MKRNYVGWYLAIFILIKGFPADAQQQAKIPRIGFLTGGSPSSIAARIEAFRHGLRELGYVEGKNIIIEWRFADGNLERLPEFAAELVRLKVVNRAEFVEAGGLVIYGVNLTDLDRTWIRS